MLIDFTSRKFISRLGEDFVFNLVKEVFRLAEWSLIITAFRVAQYKTGSMLLHFVTIVLASALFLYICQFFLGRFKVKVFGDTNSYSVVLNGVFSIAVGLVAYYVLAIVIAQSFELIKNVDLG